jgi:hypothetical protein
MSVLLETRAQYVRMYLFGRIIMVHEAGGHAAFYSERTEQRQGWHYNYCKRLSRGTPRPRDTYFIFLRSPSPVTDTPSEIVTCF